MNLAGAGSTGPPTSNWKGVNFHAMSFTSHSPSADTVLLLFKSGLLEQQRELARAIDSARKEIREVADSGPCDVVDDSCGNASKEAVFAGDSHNRTHLRNVQLALE